MAKTALIFLVALAAHAQTATISDTLTAAVGGGNWTGRITVSLNTPGSAQPLYSGTTSLAGWSATYCVGVTGSDCTATTAAGAFAATLYTNDAITPAGTSYSARFQPTRGPQWSETWTVSAGNTKLYQIRATTVPTPTTTFTAGQLALAAGRLLYGSASGVATSLAPGTNGHVLTLSGGYPVWAAGASGGAWGSITGTLSSQTDLQSALDGKLSTSGNAATATALASNPTDCSAGQYATTIAANGNLTCAQVSFAELSGTSGVVIGAGNLTTAGAVPYVSASGTLQQDAAALFWDAANNRLGIGTNSPAYALDVSGSTSTMRVYDQTATTGSTLLMVRAGAGQSGDVLRIQSNGGSDVFSVNSSGYAFVYGGLSVVNSGAEKFNFDGTVGVKMSSDRDIRFSNTNNIYGSYDSGIDREAAGVIAITDGGTGYGRLRLLRSTPSASSDACTQDSVWVDASYIYVCTASGTIKRATLNTF